jgi:hypothetical protein
MSVSAEACPGCRKPSARTRFPEGDTAIAGCCMMPTRALHRSRDFAMIFRGRVLDADAVTYLLDRHAR